MNDQPWSTNEGRYDEPSSRVASRDEAAAFLKKSAAQHRRRGLRQRAAAATEPGSVC